MESGYTTDLDIANEPKNAASVSATMNLNTKPIRGPGKATLLRAEEQQRASEVYSSKVLHISVSRQAIKYPIINQKRPRIKNSLITCHYLLVGDFSFFNNMGLGHPRIVRYREFHHRPFSPL